MLGFLLGSFRLVWLFGKGHQAVVLENLALRQQLSIYKRKQKRPRLVGRDRWFWIALSVLWKEWRRALCIVHPDTVVRWQRERFRRFATGLITNTIPCWLISVKNRSPSSETVMCLATQQSRDLVLANHRLQGAYGWHGLSRERRGLVRDAFRSPLRRSASENESASAQVMGYGSKGILADQPKSEKPALTAKDLPLSQRSPF
jgi:hypothetical protein